MDYPQNPPSKASSERKQVFRFRRRSRESRPLTLQDHYPCPICQYGQLSEMALMDAFGCDFCRHIFSAQLPDQRVQVVDSAQAISWRWNGRRWQPLIDTNPNVTIALWLISAVLVTLPCAIVSMAVYIFPPLPDSRWLWFPSFWAITTLVVHLGMVGWLLAEYYQLPLYVTGKFWLRQLFQPRPE